MQHLARVSLDIFSFSLLFGGSLLAQTQTRASVDSNGLQGNAVSGVDVAVSADGHVVAFRSEATSLVPSDTNGKRDIFVRDLLSGTTERVSVDSSGAQGDNDSGGDQASVALSADGRLVVFESLASNLVAGDTNGAWDVFVHDRALGTTERVSVDSSGVQGNADSLWGVSISADGRFVAFLSSATNLTAGGTYALPNVFVRDRQLGTTALVSVDSAGAQQNSWSADPAISADGRFVAFRSIATNLVAGDTNASQDIFVHDRQLGTTERVSVDSAGIQGNSDCMFPAISADGANVTFASAATNLVAGGTNGNWQVLLRNRQLGTTELISMDSSGMQGTDASLSPSISADGRFVAFVSYATNLVPGDTNAARDIFIRDRQSGTTERVNLSNTGAQGNGVGDFPSVSSDGRFVAFGSYASNLVTGDSNGAGDVFLCDRTPTGFIYTYCAAKTNSLGCVPSIGSVGVPSQSGPDSFYVTASNVLNNKLGMMLWSLGQASTPFFGGTLCVQQPILRTQAQMSGGSQIGSDCTGTYSYHFTQAYMLGQLLGANTTVYAQFWSRDPGFPLPNRIGLTDGLSFTVCP